MKVFFMSFRKTIVRSASILCVLGCVLTTGMATQAHGQTIASKPLTLRKAGVFTIGGKTVEMPARRGGTQSQFVGQAVVHSLLPYEKSQPYPVVMIPGMGLKSTLYLDTPDGRDGWATVFAKQGFDVYVVDEPSTVTTGLEVAAFAKVRSGEVPVTQMPNFMLWGHESIWSRWGIGPEAGKAHENGRYPIAHVDQLYGAFSPMVTAPRGGGRRGGGGHHGGGGHRHGQQAQANTASDTKSDAPTSKTSESTGSHGMGFASRRTKSDDDAKSTAQPTVTRGHGNHGGGNGGSGRGRGGDRFGTAANAAAIKALLARIGPAILIVHSSSGSTGFTVVNDDPGMVKAIVALEPVGSPTDESQVKQAFANTPYLALFGDNRASRRMDGRMDACITTASLIAKNGGQSKVIDLPAEGVLGNSHILMQDNNSVELAQRVSLWLSEKVTATSKSMDE